MTGKDAEASRELVATVSHELRAPLTGLKGLLTTVLEYWDRFDDAERQRLLQMASENADRMNRLLSELLDLSRLDAGSLAVQLVPVAPLPLVTEVVDRVVRSWTDAGGEKPEVSVELSDVPVLADPERLEQIFTNLVENALRYAEPPLRVGDEIGGDHVTLWVQDAGQGIAAGDLERIFDRFVRREGERRSGTGLGLHIVRGLVEAQGGRTWASSEQGKGSRFHVRLRRA